jgi:UDP-N-acetylmuramyl pentapeptide phosphotransferase/UDP-N-acetylglucosamine-1-phosphate transferase
VAVVLATYLVSWCALAFADPFPRTDIDRLFVLTGAGVLLAILGVIDDIRGLSPLPRLVVQCIAVGAVIASISDEPIIPFVPWWLECVFLFVGGVWFVNLVNFMDGIDWMTVAEVVPITGAMVVVGWLGLVPPSSLLIAAALLGAILGFAPFNKPVARLFLGDVGSLPIGLVLSWLLLQLATKGYLAAAILLPLYYVADATLTLFWRLQRGEPFWQAHRSHFYQHALKGGLAVPKIVTRVFIANLALVGLALSSLWSGNIFVSASTLAAGGLIVGALLWNLATWGKFAGR